ncbi:mitoguardin isoform X2 [Cimex lectularius]|uniref:Mitoguardin n=1 Tax=Cimex lectularius TaxID=79782 RepID=A0A8I6S236_CIMLE|nr:mitoguardin isoform X2 [Cimex lectularius]
MLWSRHVRSPSHLIWDNFYLSTTQKVLIISAGAGLALLVVVASHMKRRKKSSSFSVSRLKQKPTEQSNKTPATLSPNGDHGSVVGSHRSGSPAATRTVYRQPSVLSTLSDRLSAAGLSHAEVKLTPQQLGAMGMEALDNGINYWEDALAAYQNGTVGPLCLTDQEEAQFASDLQQLLEIAYKLQRKCELLFLDQRSVLFRADGSIREDSFHGDTFSSAESFVSAQDEIADLREFDEYLDFTTDTEKLALYQSAMKQFEEFGIPYRCLRTEMVHCSSDLEYLGKLHCVRLAFQWMFKSQETWKWFADSGRQILADLLLYADKDPKDFLIAYEEMLHFISSDGKIWSDIEKELSLKGVKAMTFYDVVLDYILMDAFEDLEVPPSSVTAVVQNRWLSNGFKESALATAVWSVLKAKRRMLTFPNGFMSHFYAISEQMSPLMAWGFLGPDDNLREICQFFKDQVMGFLMDTFSFQKCRYTTVEELAEDVLKHVKDRVFNLNTKLSKVDVENQ